VIGLWGLGAGRIMISRLDEIIEWLAKKRAVRISVFSFSFQFSVVGTPTTEN
jgi:hypothetical protein